MNWLLKALDIGVQYGIDDEDVRQKPRTWGTIVSVRDKAKQGNSTGARTEVVLQRR